MYAIRFNGSVLAPRFGSWEESVEWAQEDSPFASYYLSAVWEVVYRNGRGRWVRSPSYGAHGTG